MTTTATALRTSSGAVVVPSYDKDRIMDKDVAAIVARVVPKQEEAEESGPEVGEGELTAAEDIMDVLSSYGGPSPCESDSKVERATKEAARRARAKILAQALGAFIDLHRGE